MTLISNAAESLRASNRRILVTGPRASGKTTFSVSGSRRAGDLIQRGSEIECDDTLVIQGDNEGIMGAIDVGLSPKFVLDMGDTKDWDAYTKRLVQGLNELKTPLSDGTIKVLIIDLALAARHIDRSVSPTAQRDWKEVAIQGARLFNAFSSLRGVTVIGNAQIKAAVSPGETDVSKDASVAKAIGGERSTFTIDLPKGVASHWLDNASFVFTREAKRVRQSDGTLARSFKTHTQSSQRFEAKSRCESRLAPTEPGDRTLHSLLKTAYGDSY